MVIMQGDSYPIEITLKLNGSVLTPDMIDEIEICVGSGIRKLYTNGEVVYKDGQWYFRLTQEETLGMDEGSFEVISRVKFPNQPPDVEGKRAGRIEVRETHSKEVL